MRDIVSCDLYTYKSKELENIKRGKVKRIKYPNWFLISVFGYENLNRVKARLKPQVVGKKDCISSNESRSSGTDR